MKKIAFLVLIAGFLFSCGNNKTETKSAEIAEVVNDNVPVYKLDSLLAVADQLVDKTVKVRGSVTHTCKHSGKRCFIVGDNENVTMRVEAKGNIGGFNRELVGAELEITGVLKERRLTKEYIDQMEKDVNEKKIKEDFILIDSIAQNIEWAFDMEEDNIGGSFNFILPYGNENRETEIVIPDYFINLYWLYMVNQISGKELTKSIHDFFPLLELNVKYTDIHSNELSKTFLIEIRFDMIASPKEDTKELAKFRFEISEKQ